jgi:hypothetical protein
MCREDGARLAVVANWTAPKFVVEAAVEAGAPVVELGPPIWKYCRDHGIAQYQGSVLTVSERDPHFSVTGHRLVADAIRDALEYRQILK